MKNLCIYPEKQIDGRDDEIMNARKKQLRGRSEEHYTIKMEMKEFKEPINIEIA